MLKDLTPPQVELANYMAELSEMAHHAGWTTGLEHALWRAVVAKPFRYGRLDLTTEHIEQLKILSLKCGGWIYFDEANEEIFVSREQWEEMYEPTRAL